MNEDNVYYYQSPIYAYLENAGITQIGMIGKIVNKWTPRAKRIIKRNLQRGQAYHGGDPRVQVYMMKGTLPKPWKISR